MAGLLVALFWLLGHDAAPLERLRLEIVNDRFGLDRFSYFMIIMGGSYLVCPMLFGRILSARDYGSATRGCWLAVALLAFSAAIVVAVGVLCRGLVPADVRPDDVLSSAVGLMPSWVGMFLLVALLSAVLSSADSCLVTASTVLCNDLLHRRDVSLCRTVTLAFGVGGLLLATRGHGILDLLLMANDIYVCGVAVPVFAAMLMKRGAARPGPSVAAMALGGAGGLASAFFGDPSFGYAGMVCAVATMVLGAWLPVSDAKRS